MCLPDRHTMGLEQAGGQRFHRGQFGGRGHVVLRAVALVPGHELVKLRGHHQVHAVSYDIHDVKRVKRSPPVRAP